MARTSQASADPGPAAGPAQPRWATPACMSTGSGPGTESPPATSGAWAAGADGPGTDEAGADEARVWFGAGAPVGAARCGAGGTLAGAGAAGLVAAAP